MSKSPNSKIIEARKINAEFRREVSKAHELIDELNTSLNKGTTEVKNILSKYAYSKNK